MNNTYRHANVPYRSQWASPELNERIVNGSIDPCDDPMWTLSGFSSATEYRFWARRICGIACLESILDFLSIPHGTRYEMVREALSFGAYIRHDDNSVTGLIYRPFCDWVRARYQLDVDVYEHTPLSNVAKAISPSCMAFASVSSEIRNPTTPNARKGGHLILIHGTDPENILFHNPSGVPPYQANVSLRIKEAERFFARRGMFVSIPSGS
ncbi:hypothetical protein PPN31114_04938 [Pandoraea pneumonica]|jgi:hypothetical protein|uniref:Peptidase C39-like domain-containing protein n=1 Tax=Pandoraea pneumonica TaxID=2508299 RepID=A0A5E4Z018_9BURK|nr:C39 family peptidase [Pandoraea pneumonica]VVE54561.1 hypothetical protein PPN31114_04938 [Pandoraea pneumonica]